MCAIFNFFCVLTVAVPLVLGQYPQRLAIPGAVLVQQSKPAPFRQQRINPDGPPRLRRPNAPIRPVVEEEQEETALPNVPSSTPSPFDDEVKSLGLAALQNAVRQAEEDEQPRPLQFRPERPVPVLRADVRDTPILITRPPNPQFRPTPRQEENIPVVRQQQRVRQPVQAVQLQQRQEPLPRQQVRVNATPRPRPPAQYLDDNDDSTRQSSRGRKPPVQILRKYRTDNADGSITWGYENEDGTFKEETLGIDCMVRGKYGYIDPDGVKREYSYETGHKCDEPEPEEEDDLPPGKQNIPNRKPQPSLRPIQYQN